MTWHRPVPTSHEGWSDDTLEDFVESVVLGTGTEVPCMITEEVIAAGEDCKWSAYLRDGPLDGAGPRWSIGRLMHVDAAEPVPGRNAPGVGQAWGTATLTRVALPIRFRIQPVLMLTEAEVVERHDPAPDYSAVSVPAGKTEPAE